MRVPFQISSAGRTVNCLHLGVSGWPDHGVPAEPKPILEVIRQVRDHVRRTRPQSFSKHASRLPGWNPCVQVIWVHCLSGVGRTGALLLILIAQDVLLMHQGRVSFPGILDKLRQQRRGSVQSRKQYAFAVLAVLEWARVEVPGCFPGPAAVADGLFAAYRKRVSPIRPRLAVRRLASGSWLSVPRDAHGSVEHTRVSCEYIY